MPTSYSNPNFSGSNIAVNSPQINLPYLWDENLGDAGQWRPTKTGDFANIMIDNAEITVALDKDNDSVNIYTTEDQAVTVSGTDLNIRDLTSASDSVNANLQIGDVDASQSNPLFTSGVSGSSVQANSTVDNAGATGSAVTMATADGIHIKHGYLLDITTGADSAHVATFKVQGSMDSSAWIDLEVNNISGTSNTGVAYYDEWNYNYSRTIITTHPGAPGVSGTYNIWERHDI